MNIPFFYPEHPEFKAHVEYVAGEMMEFSEQPWGNQLREHAEARAKDIVLHVTSRPPRFVWLRDLVDALLFWRRDTDAMFEQGLERWLREAVERSLPDTRAVDIEHLGSVSAYTKGVADFEANLLRELDLDDTPTTK